MSCHMGSEIAFKGSKENAQGNEAEVNMAHQSLRPVWMRVTPGLRFLSMEGPLPFVGGPS